MSARRTAGRLGLAIGIVATAGCWIGSRDATAQPSGSDGQIPEPPAALEERLATESFEIRSVKGAGGGVTGAKKIGLLFPSDGLELKVKWKPVPANGDGWNNSPRRELVAYEIQKWFLDPDDYVVPTSVAICIPFETYEPVDSTPNANVRNFPCVLGIASVWLDHVTVPDKLYDPDRFDSDKRYAYHLADFNVLAYLIKHQDGRSGNFLTSKDESDRRVYAVDNGISFGVWVHNYFVPNWNQIRVSRLRKQAIDRLRAVDRKQLDALQTVAELRTGPDGILRNTPSSENLSPRKGARIGDDRVQLGLSQREIRLVEKRLNELLADVDRGEIETF